MPATKAYTRVNFENYPSTNTPLNATNLNKVDKGIDDLDDLLVTARNNIETLQSNATTDESNISNIHSQLYASNQTAGVTNVPFRFGITDNGEYGYIKTEGGADSVIPFKKLSLITNIVGQQVNMVDRGAGSYGGYHFYGSSQTINISSLVSNFTRLTVDNFLLEIVSVYNDTNNYGNGTHSAKELNIAKSYNASTGVLTLGNLFIQNKVENGRYSNIRLTVNIYII